jgi:thiosulfate/3-mercaptopyruvate sulfurtransferase
VTPPFVDAAWLEEHPEVVLADVRWYLDGRSGREAYDRGHLAGAVFVDLDAWLASPATDAEGRHPLPDPALFAHGMASLGIGDHDTVVAYDDAGGVTAARLVWMLRATGHAAALLDGGLLAHDGPLDLEEPRRPQATFTAQPWPPERLAGMDDAADPTHVVLDARDRARFLGGEDPVDPRPGHIPGARSVPCRDNVDAQGRLLDAGRLRARFEAAGVSDGASVVSYCGSGVTACHNLLALEHAGFAPGRLYPGSYSQWSRSDRPIETDEISPARPSTRVDIP